MIPRIFSTLVTALFLIATYGQSHSAESSENLYIPESLSKVSWHKEAVEFWNEHRHYSNIDRAAVRKKFSKFACDYQYLWKNGFDVLAVNVKDIDVFTNISFVFYSEERMRRYGGERNDGFEENKMLGIIEALAHSQITKLKIDGNLTPKLGEAFVTLLEGGKKFKELKIYLCGSEFRHDEAVYQMIKKIGMAATGNIDTLSINQSEYDYSYDKKYKFYSTQESPFDFHAFSVEKKLDEIKITKKKADEENKAYNEKQRQEWQKEEDLRQKNRDQTLGMIFKGIAGIVAVGAVYYGIRFL